MAEATQIRTLKDKFSEAIATVWTSTGVFKVQFHDDPEGRLKILQKLPDDMPLSIAIPLSLSLSYLRQATVVEGGEPSQGAGQFCGHIMSFWRAYLAKRNPQIPDDAV